MSARPEQILIVSEVAEESDKPKIAHGPPNAPLISFLNARIENLTQVTV
jgi:hypothetical protein